MYILNQRHVRIVLATLFVVALSGCQFMLPSKKNHQVSTWKNFNEAQVAYDKVEPGKTTLEDLKIIGYDPYAKPNITIENYLKVRERFDSLRGDVPIPKLVHECLKVLNLCIAYVAATGFDNQDRVGNALLDITGFHRETHIKGWAFEAIFVINGKVVVYKIWSGKPKKEEYVTETTPLGPFQSVGGAIVDKVNPL